MQKKEKRQYTPLNVFMARPWKSGGTLAPATAQGNTGAKENTRPQIPCGTWRNPRTGWTRMVSIADTGASKSVHHPSSFPDRVVTSSQGSKSGDSFTDASGGDVPMMGQRMLPTVGPDGGVRMKCSQVAEVAVPLTSIGELRDGEQVVAFGKHGWVIWDSRITSRSMIRGRMGSTA